MEPTAVKTRPYSDQAFGTSGVRKEVDVFAQPHYLENIVQSIFDCLDSFEGKTLVLGGDGRYFSETAIQSILKMAAANQFGQVIVGQNGLLSTPAVSHLVRHHGAFGAIILSASHNPGGKDGDFGIKFNPANGAPAQVELTRQITNQTRKIKRYWTIDAPDVDLTQTGASLLGQMEVIVVDPVDDYAKYMQQIFDFDAISKMFKKGFRFVFDGMNAVTGPYAKRIFEEMLGAPEGSVVRDVPLPDFGGEHPDPNLVYGKYLVDIAYGDNAPDMAACSDGDGDRFMVLGPSFFVNPCDSLAIMMQYIQKIPFYKGRMAGVARSMPTSGAVDLVAVDLGLPVYIVPTGWKYFVPLLDAGKVTLCGEETFAAGSDHVREKDGIWAVLFWLHVLAKTGKTVEDIVRNLWRKYGRIYETSHSYERMDSKKTNEMIKALVEKMPTFAGATIGDCVVQSAEVFSYTDPVTEEIYPNQGFIFMIKGGGRIVVRLSGTSSVGTTIRFYYSYYVMDETQMNVDVQEMVGSLVKLSHEMTQIEHFLGDVKPTIVT